MDLFLREATNRIGADDALTKVDALMIWRAFGSILQRGLKGSVANILRSESQQPLDAVMLRALQTA